MKILIVAAHPDDEILGVGGAICRHVAKGDDVYVCIVTKAYTPQWTQDYMERKIHEQKRVDELLGIKKRFNLDLPTAKLNTIPHGEFNEKITGIVDSVNPDLVYTHFEHDLNYDHTLIFRAALVATRPPKKSRLFCYETLSETEWHDKAFKPNLWIDISEFIERKIEAFKIYQSEMKPPPHPRNPKGIKVLAQKRGSEVHLEYAEAFIIIKDIWN